MSNPALTAARRVLPSRLAQTLAVAAAVRPTAGYLLASLGPDTPRTFTSRRLGQRVRLRPQADRQVARELLSKGSYELPAEVRAAVAARGPAPRVLDLGANIGLFTLTILGALGPGTTVDAVEPDVDNLQMLHANLALNGLQDRVTVHPAAAGTQAGTATLIRHDPHNTHLARAGETDDRTATVQVIDAVALAAGHDLIKIDIEGSEWELLGDSRIGELPAAAFTLEWHGHGNSPPEPERYLAELFGSAGYTVGYAENFSDNTGSLWAWRTAPSPSA